MERAGFWPTVAVVAIAAAVPLVPIAVNSLIPSDYLVEAGTAIVVGDFRFAAPAGWAEDRTRSTLGAKSTLVSQGVTLTVTPVDGDSPLSAYTTARERYEKGGKGKVSTRPQPFTSAHDFPGLSGEISGAHTGSLTVLDKGGHGLMITAEALPQNGIPMPAAAAVEAVVNSVRWA